mgnify:FL=1
MARLFVVGALILCAGCSTLPKSNKVEAFGSAVTEGSSVLNALAETNRKYAFAIGNEEQANFLLNGRNFQVSPGPDVFLDPDRVAFRREVVNALAGYGAALKAAADEGAIQKLEEASVELGEAAGKVLVAASPVASPIVSPAIKLTSRTAGYLLGNAYAGEIQSVISSRNGDVKTIVALLKDDMEIMAGALTYQASIYEGFKKANLAILAKDGRASKGLLYESFLKTRQEVDELRAAAVAASKYSKILDAIAAAHDDLAKGDGDTSKNIAMLVNLTDDVSTLISAARD